MSKNVTSRTIEIGIMSLNKIAVLLFDEVEILDFSGPLQVFGALLYSYPDKCSSISILGTSPLINVSKLNFNIEVNRLISEDQENYDLLIIPGGMGTREIIKNEGHLKDIKNLIERSDRVATVCTGSLVLAKLGYLTGLHATTHYAATDILVKLDPTIIVDRSKRFIDHDHIIIAEGVSAGIDMSFYLIEKYYSAEMSHQIRKYIEYYPEKLGEVI